MAGTGPIPDVCLKEVSVLKKCLLRESWLYNNNNERTSHIIYDTVQRDQKCDCLNPLTPKSANWHKMA